MVRCRGKPGWPPASSNSSGTVGLIVPAAFHWQPALTVVAATVLAIESLVFVWVHAKYGEFTPTILSGGLGLLMAFIAYGRMVLRPII